MKKIFLFTFLVPLALYLINAESTYNISQSNLKKIETKYGSKALKRVLLWDKMLESAKTKTTIKKLKTVNDFFNKIRYMSDRRVWKRKDYWASPFEF
ncbi:MAG: transglutaminase, partial [Campylobacterota bacterium]|nr:transglutaminase [Campylobacterota bacterium]